MSAERAGLERALSLVRYELSMLATKRINPLGDAHQKALLEGEANAHHRLEKALEEGNKS